MSECVFKGNDAHGEDWWEIQLVNPIIKDNNNWHIVCEKHIQHYSSKNEFLVRPKSSLATESTKENCIEGWYKEQCFWSNCHDSVGFYVQHKQETVAYPVCEKHLKNYDLNYYNVKTKNEETNKPLKCVIMAGSFVGQYGPCSSEINHTLDVGNFTHGLCSAHIKLYSEHSYWKSKIALINPAKHANIKKFSCYNVHQSALKNEWYCSDGNFNGLDGTLQHFGTTYKLDRPSGESRFACENHAQHWVNNGFSPKSYGTYEKVAHWIGPWVPFAQRYKSWDGASVVPTTKEKINGGWSVRTQKARGLKALKDQAFNMPDFSIYDAKGIDLKLLIGKFVRPCPMRPRHGFVDSRKVENVEQAETVVMETLAADPDAEFILMPHINAEYSGIWTPGHLAIGLGTDGATAGKTAVTVPVLGDLLVSEVGGNRAQKARDTAGITESPYVELLWNEKYGMSNALFVQLRDGPKLPNQIDFIRENIKVENIIRADGDLLKWEELMRSTLPVGTVIDHVGGSLASHYSIHAVLNNIPVMISRAPVLGEILTPTQDKTEEMNVHALRAGFALACKMEMEYNNACYAMLAGCHQTTIWSGKHDLLLGFAMGCAWRLTLIASLGEGRHYDKGGRRRKHSRDAVYEKAWKKTDQQYARSKFMSTVNLFLNGNKWPGSNFGGKSWYKLAANAVNMYNALIEKKPAMALEALNQLVHSAHNSGWGFNKFIEQRELDKTALNPVYANMHCVPEFYKILTTDTATLKSAARTWWKRQALPLPQDMGTGGVTEHREVKDGEECDCNDCTESSGIKALKLKLNKIHEITAMHGRVQPDGTIHFQWQAPRMHGKTYFTYDWMPYINNDKIKKLIEIGPKEPSYSGSEIQYTKLIKHLGDDFHGEGWYFPNEKGEPGQKVFTLTHVPAVMK